jgi:hypothetical protein
MSRWRSLVVIIALTAAGFLNGCELGWDFLKEGGGGGNVGAQANCESSLVVIGQFPPSGGLHSSGSFTANYSSPNFNGSVAAKALGLRVSRNRLWLNDLSIEVSFFPFNDSERDPRNGCLGRAILEINIPEEDLFFDDRTIEIRSTRISQTDPSAFYAEGGVEAFFEITFNPGSSPRTFTNGQLDDDIDSNPAAEAPQPS